MIDRTPEAIAKLWAQTQEEARRILAARMGERWASWLEEAAIFLAKDARPEEAEQAAALLQALEKARAFTAEHPAGLLAAILPGESLDQRLSAMAKGPQRRGPRLGVRARLLTSRLADAPDDQGFTQHERAALTLLVLNPQKPTATLRSRDVVMVSHVFREEKKANERALKTHEAKKLDQERERQRRMRTTPAQVSAGGTHKALEGMDRLHVAAAPLAIAVMADTQRWQSLLDSPLQRILDSPAQRALARLDTLDRLLNPMKPRK